METRWRGWPARARPEGQLDNEKTAPVQSAEERVTWKVHAVFGARVVDPHVVLVQVDIKLLAFAYAMMQT